MISKSFSYVLSENLAFMSWNEAAYERSFNTGMLSATPNRSIELKDNTIIIVLGASGDLAKKKTVRAAI